MCLAFIPILGPQGRIVNVSATAFESYRPDIEARFKGDDVTLASLEELVQQYEVYHSSPIQSISKLVLISNRKQLRLIQKRKKDSPIEKTPISLAKLASTLLPRSSREKIRGWLSMLAVPGGWTRRWGDWGLGSHLRLQKRALKSLSSWRLVNWME